LVGGAITNLIENPMPIYTYETIPKKPGEEPERFEVRQSIFSKALERHPETGVPVRRVITGGLGFLGGSGGSGGGGGHSHGSSCGSGFR